MKLCFYQMLRDCVTWALGVLVDAVATSHWRVGSLSSCACIESSINRTELSSFTLYYYYPYKRWQMGCIFSVLYSIQCISKLDVLLKAIWVSRIFFTGRNVEYVLISWNCSRLEVKRMNPWPCLLTALNRGFLIYKIII